LNRQVNLSAAEALQLGQPFSWNSPSAGTALQLEQPFGWNSPSAGTALRLEQPFGCGEFKEPHEISMIFHHLSLQRKFSA